MAQPPSESTRLRIGVLLDSFEVRRWVYRILDEIEQSSLAELVLVVQNTALPSRESLLTRSWRRSQFLLYAAYSRLDRYLFRLEPDAFTLTSARALLADMPVINVEPMRARYSDRFTEKDLASIRAFDLDVALRFGFRILRGDVLKIARHGVWSYHHGDPEDFRGGPPGFWEVILGHPTTGSILQELTEDLDAGKVLYRSWGPTHRRSVVRNKEHLYWKSAAFVGRKLADLHRREPEALLPIPLYSDPTSRPLLKKPTNREFLPLLLRFGIRAMREKLNEVRTESQWLLGFRFSDADTKLPSSNLDLIPITPPSDRYWADPFPVEVDGKYFVFFEEYLFRQRKGHISCFELAEEGPTSPPVTVLSRPYHLSYPFVFRWRGALFMIPETSANRTVELYRCLNFPGEWTLESALLRDLRAADATLFHDESRWWMFVNLAEEGATHARDELHLFSAETPVGPWHPHPSNPVKSDVRGARPAGRLITWQGQLFRPAQDCSWVYGRALVFHRVERLDGSEFREVEVWRTLPDWYPHLLATHTYNQQGRLTVLDGMRRISRFKSRANLAT